MLRPSTGCGRRRLDGLRPARNAAAPSPAGTSSAHPLKSRTTSITTAATTTPYQAAVRRGNSRTPAASPNAVTAVKHADAAPIWNSMLSHPRAARAKEIDDILSVSYFSTELVNAYEAAHKGRKQRSTKEA